MAVTVIISSHSRDQMICGRILNCVYAGAKLTAIPVYQAELVPGAIRGFAVGSYQLSFVSGGMALLILRIRRCYHELHLLGDQQELWQFRVADSVRPDVHCPPACVCHDLAGSGHDKSEEAIDHEIETIVLALEANNDMGT